MTNSRDTPILAGFHPDPSICRVGSRYYLATSSFEYRPGVPLFTSENLLDWVQIGHVLTRPSQIPDSAGEGSTGIYAPTLRFHGDRFWMVTTNVTQANSEQIVCWAENPEGPWSDCAVTQGCKGIDPDLTWDGDDCYLTWTTSDPANPAILQARFDPETARCFEAPRLVWRGSGLAYPEAPHLYRKDGWWYLMLAEGGTERGHAITMARSRTIQGPFDPAPTNPIFSHRSLLHPVQNTGHGDLVQKPDGTWAIVYLGVRPRGTSPGFHTNGRETFLAAVDWSGDWPRFDEEAFPLHRSGSGFTEDFAQPGLSHRWVAPGRQPQGFAEVLPGGGVEVFAEPGHDTAMLLTRLCDPYWDCAFDLDITHGAGSVLIRMDQNHRLDVEISQTQIRSVLRLSGLTVPFDTVASTAKRVTIRFQCRPAASSSFMALQGPDTIDLSASIDGETVALGQVDGRYLSTEVAGGFTGRMIGVHARMGRILLKTCIYRPRRWT